MPRMIGSGLSRREREILDVLHRLKEGSVSDVLGALADAPSYSAVRSLLRILEQKGHVEHKEDGRRFVYVATQSHPQAARGALQSVVQTFFGGSLENVVEAFLSEDDANVSDESLNRMAEMIERARREREKGID
jgi:BlaI family penicillinase repressor